MPETHRETWMTERTASVHSALQTKWLESRRPRFAPQVTAQQVIALVALAAAATLAAPPTWHAPNDSWVQAFVVLTIVSIVLEFVSVDLPFDGDLSVATISQVATILLVPAPMAAIGVGLSVLVEEVVRRRPVIKVIFNTGTYVLTTSVVSAAVGIIGSPPDAIHAHDHIRVAATFGLASVGYYVLSTLLVSTVIALATGRSVGFLLRANTRSTALAETSAAMIGGVVALIWTIEPVWTSALTLPAILVSRALRHIRQLENETRGALRSLAKSIDDRDPTTYHHSERVSAYARLFGQELGLPDDLVELITQAAAVHDLGKVGVPDRVLLKPGPLDEGDRTLMWLHTEIGAGILNHFQLFRGGANIVLHHHERWDGGGYPNGLRGEEIPLGARVVAIADAFDAMTEDRPYRPAMSVAEAIAILADGAGTQWDPEIVPVFIGLVRTGRLPGHPEHDRGRSHEELTEAHAPA